MKKEQKIWSNKDPLADINANEYNVRQLLSNLVTGLVDQTKVS